MWDSASQTFPLYYVEITGSGFRMRSKFGSTRHASFCHQLFTLCRERDFLAPRPFPKEWFRGSIQPPKTQASVIPLPANIAKMRHPQLW